MLYNSIICRGYFKFFICYECSIINKVMNVFLLLILKIRKKYASKRTVCKDAEIFSNSNQISIKALSNAVCVFV